MCFNCYYYFPVLHFLVIKNLVSFKILTLALHCATNIHSLSALWFLPNFTKKSDPIVHVMRLCHAAFFSFHGSDHATCVLQLIKLKTLSFGPIYKTNKIPFFPFHSRQPCLPPTLSSEHAPLPPPLPPTPATPKKEIQI